MTPARTDRDHPEQPLGLVSAPRLPACRSDACRSGRDKCPTHEACHLPTDDTADWLDNMQADIFADAGLAVAVCLALAFFVIVISSPEILGWLGLN